MSMEASTKPVRRGLSLKSVVDLEEHNSPCSLASFMVGVIISAPIRLTMSPNKERGYLKGVEEA